MFFYYFEFNDASDEMPIRKANKGEWFIENNTLKSKSQTFIDEYNELVKKTNVEL